MSKSTAGARRITVKAGLDEANYNEDFGQWQESNDFEVTSDPETDRDAYGSPREYLAAQFEHSDVELTRTFQLPRDRAALRRLDAFAARGGGFWQVQDQYLEPRTGAAFDVPIIIPCQLKGYTRSGANINDGNGRATIQITLGANGLPS